MSFASWKEEFYPVSADKAVYDLRNSLQQESLPTEEEQKPLLEHALKKWKGLTPKNLQKHNVVYDDRLVYAPDDEPKFVDDDEDEMTRENKNGFLRMDASSCALCVALTPAEYGCGECIITRKTGQSCVAVWEASRNDATRMIQLLQHVADNLNVSTSKEGK